MIHFFDASALVKRYIDEDDSEQVRDWLKRHLVAVSRLSELEVTSALARRCREGDFTSADRDRALQMLRRDFESFFVVEITAEVLQRSRQLLAESPLRAGDSIQLAAALELRERLRFPTTFVAFDQRLLDAARVQELDVLPQ